MSASTRLVTLGELSEWILKSRKIILSTHRQPDGDGLGCELALYHAIKQLGHEVIIVNPDPAPNKYRFLPINQLSTPPEVFLQSSSPWDLVLIFDTNDERLLHPLIEEFQKRSPLVVFIDHHPLLQNGPRPSYVFLNENAAATGEMIFDLIQSLPVTWSPEMALSLYTSIVFDTQYFRFIRSSPKIHEIAAFLLKIPFDAQIVHRHLFSHQSPKKMAFLAKVFANLEYFGAGHVAYAFIHKHDLLQFGLAYDEVRDVTDQLMTIEPLEVAIVVREENPGVYRVSLRSKGQVEVLTAAEKIGGGGHWYAAGGLFQGNPDELKRLLLQTILPNLPNKPAYTVS